MVTAESAIAGNVLVDRVSMGVGLLLALLNVVLLVCAAFGIPKDEKHSGKSILIAPKKAFDILGFLRHLQKGTFDVIRRHCASSESKIAEGATSSSLLKMKLNIDNLAIILQPMGPDTTASSVYSLVSLTSVSLREMPDSEKYLLLEFSDGKSTELTCEAEDDLIYLAEGFTTLLFRLGDQKFVDGITCGTALVAETPSDPNAGSPGVLQMATNVMSIPVMPIYGIIGMTTKTKAKP